MTKTTAPAAPLLLPGQAHAAPGPHDLTPIYLMHFGFRRDLDSIVSAVRNTPLGEGAVWTALAARGDKYFELLHHHHESEDETIWPPLLRECQAADRTEDLAMLADMEAEHAVIDPAIASCRAAFRAMVEHPCSDHRNALDVHLTGFRQSLREHMDHEELRAWPLVQELLSAEEMEAGERHARAGYNLPAMLWLANWMVDGLPAEAHESFARAAGPVLMALLRLTRPRYVRGTHRALRYA